MREVIRIGESHGKIIREGVYKIFCSLYWYCLESFSLKLGLDSSNPICHKSTQTNLNLKLPCEYTMKRKIKSSFDNNFYFWFLNFLLLIFKKQKLYWFDNYFFFKSQKQTYLVTIFSFMFLKNVRKFKIYIIEIKF